MIIDYNNKSGQIYGVITGRIHDEGIKNNTSLSVSGVSKDDISRLIVEWEPTDKRVVELVEEPIYEEFLDDEGYTQTKQIGIKKKKVSNIQYEPKTTQKDIFTKLDNGEDVYSYRVNPQTKLLEKV